MEEVLCLPAAGTDNINDINSNKSNTIVFIIKGTKLYNPVVTLLARKNRNISKMFSKGFEKSVDWKE